MRNAIYSIAILANTKIRNIDRHFKLLDYISTSAKKRVDLLFLERLLEIQVLHLLEHTDVKTESEPQNAQRKDDLILSPIPSDLANFIKDIRPNYCLGERQLEVDAGIPHSESSASVDLPHESLLFKVISLLLRWTSVNIIDN